MAAQIVAQIARFAGARETWTLVVAPVAVVVGFVGYHVEDFFTSDETRVQNNTPLESTTDLRVARELEVRGQASFLC